MAAAGDPAASLTGPDHDPRAFGEASGQEGGGLGGTAFASEQGGLADVEAENVGAAEDLLEALLRYLSRQWAGIDDE